MREVRVQNTLYALFSFIYFFRVHVNKVARNRLVGLLSIGTRSVFARTEAELRKKEKDNTMRLQHHPLVEIY